MNTLTTYLAELINTGRVKPCTACGTTDGLRIILMDTGPNYGKIVCDHCNERYNAWAPKPTTPPRKRGGKSTGLLNLIRAAWEDEPLYCLICLRDERTLPTGVWLEAHHILEHQDGGTDTTANLWPLCNVCHSQVHLLRRALNGHGTQVGKAADEYAPR